MLRKIFTTGLTTTILFAAALPAFGAIKSWNSAVNGFWNVSGNWTPPGVPGTSDDVTLGNVFGTEGTRTTLDINDTVDTLTMLNGNDFDTGDFELIADSATLSGTGTRLLVKPNNSGTLDSFDVDFMDVNAGALVQMLGGRLEIDGNTGDGRLDVSGTLTGFGFIDLEDVGAGSKFTLNGGTLNVGNTADGIFTLFDVAQTLEINATDAGARVDLDNISSTVNLLPSGTLDLNVALADPFSSTINLSRKSTLDIQSA